MTNPIDIPPEPPEKSDLAIAYETLEDVINSHGFEDVGGLKSVKKEMQRYAKAIADPAKFDKYGIRPPKGLILYGKPGMGKTLLAKCFAAEIGKYIPEEDLETTGIMFAQLNLEDFVSKYVGETSTNLDHMLNTYKKAIHQSRSQGLNLKIVLYLDEMDAIGANRDDTHEAYAKMMGVLLKYMDGMNSDKNIYWIGSTNRKDSLDPALCRPGRFDKLIEVNKYDQGGIREIYKIHMGKASEKSEFETLFKIHRWKKIEEASKNMSGAEIAEIVRRSVEYALWRDYDLGQEKIPLKEKHILKEIELFYNGRKPSGDKKRKIGFDAEYIPK